MRYVLSAQVSADTINQAERQVQAELARSTSVDFLAQWVPWQQAMKRECPNSYAALSVVHEKARESIAVKPARISEGEWLAALRNQLTQEAADIQAVTVRLTRQVVERVYGEEDA